MIDATHKEVTASGTFLYKVDVVIGESRQLKK